MDDRVSKDATSEEETGERGLTLDLSSLDDVTEPSNDEQAESVQGSLEINPDLLIDFRALDATELREDFTVGCEMLSPKSLLPTDRIARLIKSLVEYNDWPALIHILSCALVDPSPKRVRIVLSDTLRFLFAATKGRTPRRQPVQEKD